MVAKLFRCIQRAALDSIGLFSWNLGVGFGSGQWRTLFSGSVHLSVQRTAFAASLLSRASAVSANTSTHCHAWVGHVFTGEHSPLEFQRLHAPNAPLARVDHGQPRLGALLLVLAVGMESVHSRPTDAPALQGLLGQFCRGQSAALAAGRAGQAGAAHGQDVRPVGRPGQCVPLDRSVLGCGLHALSRPVVQSCEVSNLYRSVFAQWAVFDSFPRS